MKRKIITLLLLSTVLLLASCESGERTILPTGMWYQVDAHGNYYPTTFTFSGRQMAVLNSTDATDPLYDGVWEYYIKDDAELYAEIDELDYYDGESSFTTTTSYRFKYMMDDSETKITLEYKPLLGGRRTIYLVRQ